MKNIFGLCNIFQKKKKYRQHQKQRKHSFDFIFGYDTIEKLQVDAAHWYEDINRCLKIVGWNDRILRRLLNETPGDQRDFSTFELC